MARGLDINMDYDALDDDDGGGTGQDMRVSEWEDGLPSADDLTPLSQPLIPPELASAFSITPEPSRTLLDVHRASQTTISSLRRQLNPFAPAGGHRRIPSFAVPVAAEEDRAMAGTEEDADAEDYGDGDGGGTSGSSSSAAAEAEDGAGGEALLAEMSDLHHPQHPQQPSADQARGGVGVAKRARLVWTPQLHRRFVEVVAHLGVANAVPKTIMQLMNVEGLTRENVASHLQKYRLYLKRTHGHDDISAGVGPSPPPSGSFASSGYSRQPPPPPPSGSFASSGYARQPPPQQQQQRLPTPAEGLGPASLVRVPPTSATSYAIPVTVPQPVRHRHGGLDFELPREWQLGSSSSPAVLAFPHRARIAPNDSG